jgi:hypothetical protein
MTCPQCGNPLHPVSGQCLRCIASVQQPQQQATTAQPGPVFTPPYISPPMGSTKPPSPWMTVGIVSLCINALLLVAVAGLAGRSAERRPSPFDDFFSGVGYDPQESTTMADVKALNTASTIYQVHTGRPVRSQDDLLRDTGAEGWNGPYLSDRVRPPFGWSYSVDTTGKWTAQLESG